MKNIVLIPETENINELNKTYYHFMFGLLFPSIIICEKLYNDKKHTFYIKGINDFGKFGHIAEELRYYNVIDIRVFKDGIGNCEYISLPSLEHYYTRHGVPAKRDTFYSIRYISDIILNKTWAKKAYDQKSVVLINRENDHRIIPNVFQILHEVYNRTEFLIEIANLSNLSLSKQAGLFYKSKIIIAQHGSALANLPFFHGDKVIEIIPECFVKTGLDYYGALCDDLGIKRKVIAQKHINSNVDYREVLACLKD